MTENKENWTTDLEKTKDEILRKIAEKVKTSRHGGEEFGASHSSHTSTSKHRSNTH